jgi:hypothetical protein
MARFSGEIGYSSGGSREVPPDSGIWVDEIVEKPYFGDVIRNTRRSESGDRVVPNITIGNSISIVADEYANEHYHNMRYARWEGALWTIDSVEVRRPRLILELGEVYNGPTA